MPSISKWLVCVFPQSLIAVPPPSPRPAAYTRAAPLKRSKWLCENLIAKANWQRIGLALLPRGATLLAISFAPLDEQF